MIGAGINLLDLIGGFVAFFLTLVVLSYTLGDNLLFRLAIYLFVGVSAGFVAAAAFYGIIWPQLIRPLAFGTLEERLLTLVPFILSILLATKAIPKIAATGTPVMAFLVGVGAATIVGGALAGTLFPQLRATFNLLDDQSIINSGVDPGLALINGSLILVGIVATLASFQFGTRFMKNPSFQGFWKYAHGIGRIFIAITFGVIFAGVYTAALTALVERFKFVLDFILSFVAPAS
jgi:hypothetical protein